MPLPTEQEAITPRPREGEEREEFINRCVEDEGMKSRYRERGSRQAMCESLFDEVDEDRGVEDPAIDFEGLL